MEQNSLRRRTIAKFFYAKEAMRIILFTLTFLLSQSAGACVMFSDASYVASQEQFTDRFGGALFGAFVLNEEQSPACNAGVFSGMVSFLGFELRPHISPEPISLPIPFIYDTQTGSCEDATLIGLHVALWDSSGYPYARAVPKIDEWEELPTLPEEFSVSIRGLDHGHIGCYSRHGDLLNLMADYAQACLNGQCPELPGEVRDEEGFLISADISERDSETGKFVLKPQSYADLVPPLPEPNALNWAAFREELDRLRHDQDF